MLSHTTKNIAYRLIGVISDTHGLLRPEAKKALQGADLILHAGDIGKPQVLEELRTIAPVMAVRGNIDKGHWAKAIPESKTLEVGAVSIYMLHNIKELNLDPSVSGCKVIISGHSHKPSVQEVRGVLFINPGSAGPRRFKLPVSVAHLQIGGERVNAQLVELLV